MALERLDETAIVILGTHAWAPRQLELTHPYFKNSSTVLRNNGASSMKG